MIKNFQRTKWVSCHYCFVVLLLLLPLFSCSANDADTAIREWSDTSPAINLKHVFQGEINRRGKPTGFHARPGGKDPSTARLSRVMSKPNKRGVYTARIEVYDKTQKQWREKFSSLFPDALSQEEVIQAILHAYKNRNKKKNKPWNGPSGLGFPIQGYLHKGKINTAFPVFQKD